MKFPGIALVTLLTIGNSPVQQQAATANTDKSDIVVLGRVDPPAEDNSRSAGAVGALDEMSVTFARCIKHIDPKLLRKVIDSPPDGSTSIYSLDRAIRMNIGCYRGYATPASSEPFLGECHAAMSFTHDPPATVCRAPLDRAALQAEAIHDYVPNAALTLEDTGQAAVRARLFDRVRRLNVSRRPSDRRYVAVTICMVGNRPDIATGLIHAYGDATTQGRLAKLLIDSTPECTGNAQRVRVDRVEFRNYVQDAFYQWLAATRDVPSLIPGSD